MRNAAVEFLSEGRARGERLMYVGAETVPALRGHLAGLEDLDEMLGDGSLLVLSLSSIYPLGTPIDPESQVGVYIHAIDEALADGFTGLRIAADVTALATVPANRDALTRYEHLADEVAVAREITAMCCYERGALPAPLIGDLVDAHPAVHETLVS